MNVWAYLRDKLGEKMKKFIIAFLGLLTFGTLNASIINIPTEYSTIQEGINIATNGDTVLVQSGTYVENINYNGKNITVGSLFLNTQDTTYISQTIIDGDSVDSVVKFVSGEDTTAIICGFTITNGQGSGDSYLNYTGGGITFINSSPRLENVTIIGNSANNGGGIYCRYHSSPSLVNVTITGNYAEYGGGMHCHNCSPRLANVTITGNSAHDAGGIACDYRSSPSLENVTIIGNSASNYGGGGMSCSFYSSPSLENVTIIGNSAMHGGGIYCDYYSSPSLVNVIISNNTGNYGIYIASYNPGNPSLSYSDFYNNENGNFYGVNDSIGVNVTVNANGDSCDAFYNIQLDPLFVDPLNEDYHLSWVNYPIQDSTKSPCIDAGYPTSPLDPDGTIADMGTYYFNQSVAIDEPPDVSHDMLRNYPNPICINDCNQKIAFSVKKPSIIKIQLYNVKGQYLETLLNERKNIGAYVITHNIENRSSGIYFIKLDFDGNDTEVKKMVILR